MIDSAKCATCHSNLSFVHSGMRNDAQECPLCHNPALVDGTSTQSVNMAWQIHSIHRGENLANPYILGTTNYQDVRFPGDLRDCTTCHMTGTYLVENVGAKAPGGQPRRLHQDDPSDLGGLPGLPGRPAESCAAGHSAGEEFSVDRVHQRIF